MGKRSGHRARSVASVEPRRRAAGRLVPLEVRVERLRRILVSALDSRPPFSHQQIADYACSLAERIRRMEDRWSADAGLRDPSNVATIQVVLDVAEDIDAQWELMLANSYGLDELRVLDLSRSAMPIEWFEEWVQRLAECRASRGRMTVSL